MYSMKKIYYLATCSTCNRIIKELNNGDGFGLQNIKEDRITPEQLATMAKMSGSYEALFSRRALKYKALGLKNKELTEKDYRNYILNEYTFLKRPVIIIDDEIFVGNGKKTIEAVKQKL
jgi:arsenate reductase (glutaredoxin)